MRARITGLFGVALICALTAACTQQPPAMERAPVSITTNRAADSAAPEASGSFPKLGGTAMGSLVSSDPFTTIEPRVLETGAAAYRIRYLSSSAVGGTPVEVTASVFVPGGDPPPGGWRVVAFNHGNTGIGPNCGPSLYDDLLGQWLPVGALLLNGYLVVASDYEGLGGAGGSGLKHTLLDSTALGRNVIDGVRAARQLVPNVSDRWAAFGGSLGGLATWAANEQASTYGDGLELVGAAAWVPMVNASELPAKAAAGTLTRDQMYLYFLAIMALKATTHPELVVTDFVRGAMFDNRDLLLLCTGPRVPEGAKFLTTVSPTDLVPISPQAAQQMSGWLGDMAVPKQRTAAPMLVIYGTADNIVDQSWIDAALARSCGFGDSMSWYLRPGEGHGDIDASQAFPWVNARFDGQSAVNMCPV